MTGNWTEEDDELLIEKVEEIGQRWAAIARHFPGRTDIGVKNRWLTVVAKQGRESRVGDWRSGGENDGSGED
jgi:hypothetical protein